MKVLCLDPTSACKTWAILDGKSRKALLVDPVLDRAASDRARLSAAGYEVERIVDTHTHADHLSGGTLLGRELQVPYAMHKNTAVTTVTEKISDGDVVRLGDLEFRVLHMPGHTKDSLCLLGEGHLVTGDFLFLGEGGAGRTDLLGGDPGEHWDSLQRLSGIADDVVVLPGHDYRGGQWGRLGDERRRNPRLQCRTRDEYVRWLSGFRLGAADWMNDVVRANVRGAVTQEGVAIPSGGACCEVAAGGAGSGESITVAGLHPLVEAGQVLVLDVREPWEFTGPLGHVPGARNVPLGTLQDRLDDLSAGKERDLYVICQSGGRSSRAVEFLKKAGFSRAINVAGGTRAWVAAGLPQSFSAEDDPPPQLGASR